MWKYDCITRHEFELIKDKVEKFILMHGGRRADGDLPHERTTLVCGYDDIFHSNSSRPIFEYNGLYYRVDEVCFPDKPFIVIEYGTYDDALKNCMEDIEPFPYDLTEEELSDEVKYSLGIEPYPEDY